jgi:hypothetical protein
MPPAMIGLRSSDRPGRSMASMVSACSKRSRTCGNATDVTAPLVSFIVAQISPMALLVPEEPNASFQPKARYVPANCWNSAETSASACFQRLRESLPSAKKRRVLATQPACRLSRSIASRPVADDEFRGPAADVDHQSQFAGLRRLRMRDAEVHQTRFFAAGHDFDRVAQRGFGRQQERLRHGELAHGVGRDGAHALRWDVAQALAETLQAFERAVAHVGIQSALAVEAFGQAHHVAQAIHDAQLPEHVARDHHVEAVRSQVDRGEQVPVLQRQGGGDRAGEDVVHVHNFASSEACAECGMSFSLDARRS